MSPLSDILRRKRTALIALCLLVFVQLATVMHLDLVDHSIDEVCEVCIAHENGGDALTGVAVALPVAGAIRLLAALDLEFRPRFNPSVTRPRGPPALSS